MKNLMKTLNVPADMPIQNKMISNSIESAQKKVEGNNFDIRKHLVEYDDVINKHRTAIYKRRREIIEIAEGIKQEDENAPQSLSEIILGMIEDEIVAVVNFHTSAETSADWNIQEIYETVKTIFSTSEDLKGQLDELVKKGGSAEIIRESIINYLQEKVKTEYSSLEAKFNAAGMDFKEIEKGILIRSIDQLWVEHLEAIDYLRRGIGLRGYGQRDPLVEYKKEAFRLYQELVGLINKNVTYSIFKTAQGLVMAMEKQAENSALKIFANQSENKLEFSGAQKEMQRQAEGRNTIDLVTEKVKNESGEKVGRNDPCPCGSGKKYKKCCGA